MLSGLTADELEQIASAVTNFSEDSAAMIESGFDNDQFLEFHEISVNISSLNGYELSMLESGDDDVNLRVIENGDFITIHSFALCRESHCAVISGQSAAQFDNAVFSVFVTAQFMDYFGRNQMVTDLSRRLGTESNLNFTVLSVGESMVRFPDPDPVTSSDYIYFGLSAVSGMIGMVGAAAFVYEKGFIPKITRKVDQSLWSAWLGMALQFWDFASDISLSHELWTHEHLWDAQRRLILICAIGSTAFIVIPYLSNLYIAGNIKRMIRHNDTALTWSVPLHFVTLTEVC